MQIKRHFTKEGVDPYSDVRFITRDVEIKDSDGNVIFKRKAVSAPDTWSDAAVNIVASKYFTPDEWSVGLMIMRVASKIASWSQDLLDNENESIFFDELRHVLINQMASFNSPVWFNVGVDDRPQCSACFINSVDDTMESLLSLAKTEGMLFKHGSGSGVNLSNVRSSGEPLAGGGTASGPVPFMKGFDSMAGAIKSGGKTRRAAKMVVLDVDHPDILKFINAKVAEEHKAHALIEAGYDAGFTAEDSAYDSVAFQNTNHSVRVTDEFMRAVMNDEPWTLKNVTDGSPAQVLPARELFHAIAKATWTCGDPGIQFTDTINDWHTCKESGDIRASNPCSEFVFLDNSACNLASINLVKFWDGERFDIESFRHVCHLLITAQELMVDNASYPTEEIAFNSAVFRPLGLGYTNLGALLMQMGLGYSNGKILAAQITALMTGAAYEQSSELAKELGAFGMYERNAAHMNRVVRNHRSMIDNCNLGGGDIAHRARRCFNTAIANSRSTGFRNAQVTVLAPTGTISFMMDCDTTGIEPAYALVMDKTLVGGGTMRIVNRSVRPALKSLGYDDTKCEAVIVELEETGYHGIPSKTARDVLACATGPNALIASDHIAMMKAVQPFLSGAISKTVNLPHDATVEHIEDVYVTAWQAGLKAITVYRDSCKGSQALNVVQSSKESASEALESPSEPPTPVRRRLPDERHAITHRFSIGQHEGYLTVGLYDDGTPGEIFCRMAKEGSTISGLMDAFATVVSMALQYGVPLEAIVTKFSHMRFEPAGFTRCKAVPIAKSIPDYLARWLAHKFAAGDSDTTTTIDAPACSCGTLMQRAGSCYSCPDCGETTGCG